MLKRKAYHDLLLWKNNPKHKTLIVQGARQVGKTYIIREFAKNEYEDFLEINFKETPSAKEIFSGDLSVDSMISALKFRYPEKMLEPGKILLFLDEIQECEEALTSLKFWTDDERYSVIASGSLLGIDYKRASSYPVGYVEYLHMNGLDFEEFLWGIGIKERSIEDLKRYLTKKESVPESIHNKMMDYFRMYIAIGGMPAIVSSYLETKDYRVVHKTQGALLQDYQYDIAHYATADEKIKAEKCFLSLSKQLLDKENHKFQYKEIESGGRAQKYYSSIDWLIRADIVYLSRLVTDIRYDLDDYARNDFFRAYPADLSLLIGMKDLGLKQHIIENTLEKNTKGGLYEATIADILHKKGFNLYFYKNETTKKEIDFLFQDNGKVLPVEVKSGNNRSTSLTAIISKWPELDVSYKFIDGNIGLAESGILTLPLYMAQFI